MKITLTGLLIVANVAAYIWQKTTSGGVDYDHGYLTPQAVLQYGQWWRIYTAAFLHANEAHIGLNMLALYSLGNEVEPIYGKPRFALLYVLAIVGSGLAIVEFSSYKIPTLGASGAIYGLFGALVAIGVRVGKPGRAVVMNVVPVILLNLAFTFSMPGISWQAHVGGLITGFLVGLVLLMGARTRRAAYAYANAYAARATPVAAAVPAPQPTPHIQTVEHPPE